MDLSFWEQKSWFSHVDFCIVGSGIVGLSCAIQLKTKHPDAKVLVLEKGILPQGASTKNAGFACFGSVSELLSDLENHTEQEVINLVKQRLDGLHLLKENLGEKQIDYQSLGSYEVFQDKDVTLFEKCEAQISYLNQLLQPIFNADVFHLKPDYFHFGNTLPKQIYNAFEGQIDTGKMMQALLKKAHSLGVLILNTIEVKSFTELHQQVEIQLADFTFKASRLFIANNAFVNSLLDLHVTPVRNQVLVTKPIKNLRLKGTFHLDEGYFYFRNINQRILLGGGRNLDHETETTSNFAITNTIQSALERLLSEVILPNQHYDIEQRWSGILGVGQQKKPIVKPISNRVYCAVRLGGMGVAIGSQIGKDLADLLE